MADESHLLPRAEAVRLVLLGLASATSDGEREAWRWLAAKQRRPWLGGLDNWWWWLGSGQTWAQRCPPCRLPEHLGRGLWRIGRGLWRIGRGLWRSEVFRPGLWEAGAKSPEAAFRLVTHSWCGLAPEPRWECWVWEPPEGTP